MKNSSQDPLRPGHDQISRLAYQLWEQGGRPQGRDMDIWLKAEQQLTSGNAGSTAATLTSTAKSHISGQALTLAPDNSKEAKCKTAMSSPGGAKLSAGVTARA